MRFLHFLARTNRPSGAVSRHLRRTLLLLSLGLCWPLPILAGGGPENVALVVNGDSWASMTLANEYVHLRKIPPSHVIYLTGLPSFEQTDVESFREKILMPVLTAIWDRNLLDQIDYVIYSSDLPTAINIRADLGKRKLPKVFTPVASINGLTFLYQKVLAKDVDYLRLNANNYMRRPISMVDATPVTEEDRKAAAEAAQKIAQKDWEHALEIYGPLAAKRPGDATVQYNLACCLARLDKKDEALKALAKAVDAGWADRNHTAADEDLAPLRGENRYRNLLDEMDANKAKAIDIQPTLGFRATYVWDGHGRKVDSGGSRYLLSTVLAVTSGRGNSVSEAIRSLRRSVAADATAPTGTIYFLTNSNIRAKTREPFFHSAVKALEQIGVHGAIVQGILPDKKEDVLGAMIGAASFQWEKSGSQMVPGAICEHLTSLGGVMRERGGQTPLSELIRYGAAGSSGTVTEPFAIQQKFPVAFLHVHYAKGCSLAESYYQSVFGPYQLLIVGDALCQPFARPPEVTVSGLSADQPISGSVSFAPGVTADDSASASIDHFELFVDGRRTGTCRPGGQLTLDTSEMTDGMHDLRVVCIVAGAIETQGRLLIPVRINNHEKQVVVSLAQANGKKVRYDHPLSFQVTADGATSIALLHNARKLGRVVGQRGMVTVDPQMLGMGPVAVRAVAQFPTASATSQPLQFSIEPPPAQPAIPASELPDQTDGLLVTFGQEKPSVVTDTRDRSWLTKRNAPAGQAFVMRALFKVPAGDIYQFQLRGNSATRLLVDGQEIWQAAKQGADSSAWNMLPVHLAAGTHRFTLEGKVAKSPSLDIRFGGPGCTSLDGKRFRHERKSKP